MDKVLKERKTISEFWLKTDKQNKKKVVCIENYANILAWVMLF